MIDIDINVQRLEKENSDLLVELADMRSQLDDANEIIRERNTVIAAMDADARESSNEASLAVARETIACTVRMAVLVGRASTGGHINSVIEDAAVDATEQVNMLADAMGGA